MSASSRISGSFAAASNSSTSMMTNTNFDGKGTYLVFNVGDAVFICDLNSQEKVINYFWWLCFFSRLGCNVLVLRIFLLFFDVGSSKVYPFQ